MSYRCTGESEDDLWMLQITESHKGRASANKISLRLVKSFENIAHCFECSKAMFAALTNPLQGFSMRMTICVWKRTSSFLTSRHTALGMLPKEESTACHCLSVLDLLVILRWGYLIYLAARLLNPNQSHGYWLDHVGPWTLDYPWYPCVQRPWLRSFIAWCLCRVFVRPCLPVSQRSSASRVFLQRRVTWQWVHIRNVPGVNVLCVF